MNKKYLILLLIMAIVVTAFAAPRIIDGQQTDKVFMSKSADDAGTILEFSLPEMVMNDVEVEGQTYQRFDFENAGFTIEAGYPELPTFNTFVAISERGNVSVEMTVLQEDVYENVNIYPAQGVRLDGMDPPFSINTNYYSGKKQWSQKAVAISEPMILRDFRVASLTVNPMEYNPVTKRLRVLREVEVQVRNEGGTGQNELIGARKQSRSFENIYRSMITNYETLRDEEPEYQQRSMIVIYPFNSQLQQYIDSFIDWKRNKGFKVIDAPTNEIGTSTSAIKNYIQDQYETLEDPPEFVVLIGDVGGTIGIPTWIESFTTYDGEGDYPYTLLAGNDYLPEMCIGRISVSNVSEFMTYLTKVNIYERNINMDDTAFYRRNLLVGDTTPSGLSCVVTNKYIKELMLAYQPDHTFTELYSGDPSPNDMNAAMNNGTLFFNYRGYGGMSGYDNYEIEALTNYNKLVNTVILTCDTGSFGSFSRTEDFIRVGSPSTPTGAISSIGLATIGTHTRYNNTITSGIFAGIFEYDMRTMGEALVAGEMQMYRTYQNVDWTSTQAFIHWCNQMGDPTLDILTDIPIILHAEYADEIPLGQMFIEVEVTDETNDPVEDAWVTARMDEDAVYATGYTDENGHIILRFNDSVAGDVSLVVTKPNYKPVLGGFDILNSGSIAYNAMNIDDDASGESQGDGDGEANPGETIELVISLRNFSSSSIANVSGELTTDDPYVTISDSEEDFGTISANGTAECTDDFDIYIHPDVPDNREIEFTLDLGVNGVTKFWLPIRGNDLDIMYWDVSDNGNDVLDTGETAPFFITVKNNGAVNMDDVCAVLRCPTGLIDIEDSLATFGDIMISESVQCTQDGFILTGRTQLVTGMQVELELMLYNESGYHETEYLTIPIGIVTVDDPLGPDAHGYLCYDSGDTDYYQVPSYDWVEIDPNLGGYGTNTGMSDTAQEGDEIVIMELPFPFSFYGKSETIVSISTNGWITFGETEQVTFRNFIIPGPMGPSPMIAAFWDDLYTTGGGVYTYFDSDMNYFVIEWSNCKNSAGNATETFEIILYDPAFYPTSTGDGEIKIQYHTFNNVDSNVSSGGPQGNYCSVGIEDETALVGLNYTYNNEYPTAARHLASGMALLFTGIPLSMEHSYLTMGDLFLNDTNGNGLVESGEMVNLGISLNNIGQQTAQGVHATLSSTDQYVEVLSNHSYYPNIEDGGSEYGTSYFSFIVDEDVPDGYMIPFLLEASCTNGTWSYTFYRKVYKPSIEVDLYLINDEAGNGNGTAEPGEDFTYVVSLLNTGLVDAHNVVATVSTTSQYLDITTPTFEYGMITFENSIQGVFGMSLSSSAPSETGIPVLITITADGMEPIEVESMIGSGVSPGVFEEHFTTFLPDGWTIDANAENWTQSLTASAGGEMPEVKFNWSPQFEGTSRMITHQMNLIGATNVSVQFKYSLDDYGHSGYSIGLAARSDSFDWTSLWEIAPADDISMEIMTVNVPQQYVNAMNLQFAWYFSGRSFNINQWYIDDVVLNAILGNGGTISGIVTLDNPDDSPEHAVVKAGDYSTHPDSTGSYKLYVPKGEFPELRASNKWYEPASYYDLEIDFGDTLEDYDFNLSYFVPPTGLTFTMEDETMILDWNYGDDRGNDLRRNGTRDRLDFSHFKVYRQIDTSNFMEIATTEDMTFSEVIDTTLYHEYYVTAIYTSGESDSTNHVTSADWYPHDANPDGVPAFVNHLGKNYPNPFNPETTIQFSIANKEETELIVYNVKGQRVRTLIKDKLEAGKYTIRWQGENDTGKQVSSGVYFYKLKAGDFSSVQKMLLLK